ncbi:sensor histidine kinase [Streptomyces sp. Je 1-79]|uniref:sensor histidine kinase n=1 Tax=Streptomyces sp. Je 1-79 TaxID=2943847 RepID=UPI0021A5A2C5|nr:sensor histidine kinase [Streptomyces sp. Je 1-79]MCT4354300.1 sensor histidine kinase [Streptomyces sp. Je 1-79]
MRAMTVEERWQQFFRWGPYGLLVLATVLAAAAADLIMDATERTTAAVLVLVALALQAGWDARRRRTVAHRARTSPARRTEAAHPDPAADAGDTTLCLVPGAPGTASVCYFVLRTALAFALTWLNPFFAVYACIGFFDAVHLLPPRLARAGLLCTAVTMAGSQSGGLPPASLVNWFAFVGLFALNACLAVVFSHLGTKEAEKAAERAATITELARTNARLEQALAENAALQAQLLLQAREAGVAHERRRLAAEIHDTIAQGLTGIIAQLQVVTATPDPALARVHVQRAAGLARHSLGEARRSVQNLSPVALEHDTLPEALKNTVATWSERTGITTRFTVTGTEEPLHDEVAATLLRIAQEALANAERHSGASRAGVTLSYMGDEITLDVRDDGHGFDPRTVPARTAADGGGFGLDGMRARAERLAGCVTVEAAPGEGTAISARVPLVHHG